MEDGSPQVGEAVDHGDFRRDSSNFGGDFAGVDEVASLGSWWMENNQEFTMNSVWIIQIVNLASLGQGSSQADECEEQCNLHFSAIVVEVNPSVVDELCLVFVSFILNIMALSILISVIKILQNKKNMFISHDFIFQKLVFSQDFFFT